MNIIERVRDILAKFPRIGEICNEVHIDFADTNPTSYGLSSIGDSLVKKDILGNQRRRHTFMLYSTFSGINDYERLNNSSALLELASWLEMQKGVAVTSVIGDTEYGGEILEIKAANGMLYSVPQEHTADGVQYQLQIIADYSVKSGG